MIYHLSMVLNYIIGSEDEEEKEQVTVIDRSIFKELL